jgi:dTDP-4-amino-4,6-dideoxygalactose transaminase
MQIPFNKPYLTGNETKYIEQAVLSGKISGNGMFTQKCQRFFEKRYGFKKCLLTTSCTDALEMAAILCDIKQGDEVIIPSYTFVSTALAFVRQGAVIVFADSQSDNPNIDVKQIETLITPKTKVIVPVHYAGVACNMQEIMKLANKFNLLVVEDAAQGVDSYYKPTALQLICESYALGSIGHMATFSFHETKNIISGEGGMLAINDDRFINRAEIIWEKGTNRVEFFRGEVNKYSWVDIGSSFLPSEVIAAFLWAQIEHIDEIQNQRKQIWNEYYVGLKPLADKRNFSLPIIPNFATNNAHMFYLICNSIDDRSKFIAFMKKHQILVVSHYLSLHSSLYYKEKHDGRMLSNCDRFADCIVRLPMYYELNKVDVLYIISIIKLYFRKS